MNDAAPVIVEPEKGDAVPGRVVDQIVDQVAAVPVGRIGEPEDIARATAWMASDDADTYQASGAGPLAGLDLTSPAVATSSMFSRSAIDLRSSAAAARDGSA